MANEPTTETTTEEQPIETAAAQTPEETRAELERTRKALKDANKESAERRKKLEGFEKAEKERADKDLSEVERLKKETAEKDSTLTKAQSELRTERVHNAIELAALALDFHDPDDAIRPEVIEAIEFDDDGRVVRASVKKALEALAKSKPHLVEGGERRSADGSPPSRSASGRRPPPSKNDDTDREHAVQLGSGRYGFF